MNRIERECYGVYNYCGFKIGQRGNGDWEVWNGDICLEDGFAEREDAEAYCDENINNI